MKWHYDPLIACSSPELRQELRRASLSHYRLGEHNLLGKPPFSPFPHGTVTL